MELTTTTNLYIQIQPWKRTGLLSVAVYFYVLQFILEWIKLIPINYFIVEL